VQAYERVHQACAKHGKVLGMGGIYDNATMQRYIALGARFVLGGSDLTFIMTAAHARAEFLRGIKL
jgi:2-keto-3-deoxy-L-rhamnonate aldolase RhmA